MSRTDELRAALVHSRLEELESAGRVRFNPPYPSDGFAVNFGRAGWLWFASDFSFGDEDLPSRELMTWAKVKGDTDQSRGDKQKLYAWTHEIDPTVNDKVGVPERMTDLQRVWMDNPDARALRYLPEDARRDEQWSLPVFRLADQWSLSPSVVQLAKNNPDLIPSMRANLAKANDPADTAGSRRWLYIGVAAAVGGVAVAYMRGRE